MSLRSRIQALEKDLEQAKRDHELEHRWKEELLQAEANSRHVSHHLTLPRYGVDYAFGRPTPAALQAQGVSFVGRYLTGQGKALEHDEARALTFAGIDIVSIMEEGSEDLLSVSKTRSRARQALDAARAIGMPRHRPIYFAADFDAQGEQILDVLRSLAAAKEELKGRYYAGIYGGINLVQAAQDKGFAFAYQTLAWSNGQWDRRAQLRQTAVSGPTIHGVQCDTDWAHAADFGQWRL